MTALGKFRLGVLASGRGSNLQAIIDACRKGSLDAEVAIVISDNPGAYALERARTAGIPALALAPGRFASKTEYEQAVLSELRRAEVEAVALAGYMRLVGETLRLGFPERILNIHPALLPAFPGLHAQEQAWEYGVKYSGCTVHFIDEGMDSGPIIMQAAVPVLDEDTAKSLAERILVQEHRIYPQALQLLVEGRLEIVSGRVRLRPAPAGQGPQDREEGK